jgi:hypothetical protein
MNSQHYTNHQITGIVNQQQFIDPPKSELIEKKKTVIYVVDSRDRNRDLYPNPSNYQVELSEEFRDVQAIELLSIQLPEVIYTINQNNDRLNVYYGNKCIDITFLHGKYNSGTLLAKCIETGLNNYLTCQRGQVLFEVYYVRRLHKLVIKAKDPLCLNSLLTLNLEGRQFPYGSEGRYEQLYPERCVGDVIGFPPGIYDMCIGSGFINQLEDTFEPSNVDQTDTLEGLYTYLVRTTTNLSLHFARPLADNDDHDNSANNNMPLTELVDKIYIQSKNHNPMRENVLHVAKLIKRKDLYVDGEYGWYIGLTSRVPHGEYRIFTDYLVSPAPIELTPHKYILLKVPKCRRLMSKDKATASSFAKIPLGGELQFLNQNGIGVLKRFNPALPLLDRLQIQFLPYKKGCDSSNKEVFDFAGGEHVLVFALVFHKQNLKYSELTT